MEHKSPRDSELLAKGWKRQFSTDEPRLSEAEEEYRSLGFEVLIEPVEISPADGNCTACLTQSPEVVKVIYTRLAKGAENFFVS